MGSLHLVASPDDYLLEVALAAAVAEARTALGDVEPEVLPSETTPHELAVELCSPSLFAPCRLLVLSGIGSWVDAPGRRGKGGPPPAPAEVEVGPLVEVLGDGVPEGVGLVLGACCQSRPAGALVDAVEAHGRVDWQPVPAPPKPWEDVVVSEEQAALLGEILRRTAGDVRFTEDARRLLIERLGFAPRALVQEARKLAVAASSGEVDEELVRTLSFPRERSLDVVWDAVMERRLEPVLELVAAADAGLLVRDRSGDAVRPDRVAGIVLGQAVTALLQLLSLRRLAARLGLADEMAPEKTAVPWWYPRHFSKRIAPRLLAELEAEGPSPLLRASGAPPSAFRLGGIFRGAGRWRDDELVAALASAGRVEAATRGAMAPAALAAWLGELAPRG